MKKTLRVNFTLDIDVNNMLEEKVMEGHRSRYVNDVLRKDLNNPILRLKQEKREHIQKANLIDEQIKEFERQAEEQKREKEKK